MDQRPNFYEFLEVDPKIDDWESLKTTLAKMRNRWTVARALANWILREKAELGLSLLDEMERVFRDPKLRREEAGALRRKHTKAKAKRAEELDRLIDRLRREAEGCSEEQFQRLKERFRGVFDEATISNKLEAAGLFPRAGRPTGSGLRHGFLDEKVMQSMDQYLKICGQPDLYALLEISPDLPLVNLFHAADHHYKEIIRVGKRDPVSNAEKELAGIGLELFKSSEGKERYDHCLQARPLMDLQEEIELAGAFGKLKGRDLGKLADQAVALGVEREIAHSYLLNYAEQRGWEVVTAQAGNEMGETVRRKRRAERKLGKDDEGRKSTGASTRRNLRVFLCHASEDKRHVHLLYQQLLQSGFRPWLDQENLIPGQDWDLEITKAVRKAHVVIVCLSKSSNKRGYVQKEITRALDVADEQPEGAIFLIPARLEDCDLPDRLTRWQRVDLFREGGYAKLEHALKSAEESGNFLRF